MKYRIFDGRSIYLASSYVASVKEINRQGKVFLIC